MKTAVNYRGSIWSETEGSICVKYPLSNLSVSIVNDSSLYTACFSFFINGFTSFENADEEISVVNISDAKNQYSFHNVGFFYGSKVYVYLNQWRLHYSCF